MLPKKFYLQNDKKRKQLLLKVKLYTITYDYILNPYYGDYIKESFDKWGNIVDVLGIMRLSGYEKDEVEYNFRQIMKTKYIETKKIKSFTISDISETIL